MGDTMHKCRALTVLLYCWAQPRSVRAGLSSAPDPYTELLIGLGSQQGRCWRRKQRRPSRRRNYWGEIGSKTVSTVWGRSRKIKHWRVADQRNKLYCKVTQHRPATPTILFIQGLLWMWRRASLPPGRSILNLHYSYILSDFLLVCLFPLDFEMCNCLSCEQELKLNLLLA